MLSLNKELAMLFRAALLAWVVHYALIGAGLDSAGLNLPLLLSGALTAGSLFLLAITSRARRGLLLLVLTPYLCVHYLMIQLEAWVFQLGSIGPGMALGLLLLSLGLVAPFCVAGYFPGTARPIEQRDSFRLGWSAPVRIVLGATLFPLLYFLAGATILPFVRVFYADLIPPIHELMLWQWLRGLVFTLASLPLILCFRGGVRQAALVLATVFPLLGGIAPLLLPNPLLPAEVRLVHAVEIAASYIAYGALLAYLLYPLNGRSTSGR